MSASIPQNTFQRNPITWTATTAVVTVASVFAVAWLATHMGAYSMLATNLGMCGATFTGGVSLSFLTIALSQKTPTVSVSVASESNLPPPPSSTNPDREATPTDTESEEVWFDCSEDTGNDEITHSTSATESTYPTFNQVTVATDLITGFTEEIHKITEANTTVSHALVDLYVTATGKSDESFKSDFKKGFESVEEETINAMRDDQKMRLWMGLDALMEAPPEEDNYWDWLPALKKHRVVDKNETPSSLNSYFISLQQKATGYNDDTLLTTIGALKGKIDDEALNTPRCFSSQESQNLLYGAYENLDDLQKKQIDWLCYQLQIERFQNQSLYYQWGNTVYYCTNPDAKEIRSNANQAYGFWAFGGKSGLTKTVDKETDASLLNGTPYAGTKVATELKNISVTYASFIFYAKFIDAFTKKELDQLSIKTPSELAEKVSTAIHPDSSA